MRTGRVGRGAARRRATGCDGVRGTHRAAVGPHSTRRSRRCSLRSIWPTEPTSANWNSSSTISSRWPASRRVDWRKRSSIANVTLRCTERSSPTLPICGCGPCRSPTTTRTPGTSARSRASTTSGLVADYAAGHADVDAYHLEAYERLAALAEMRGGSTTRHTSGVGDLAAEIGHAIGQQPEWCERLRLAARLHDIGKVAVNDRLLLKPGPLTVEEFDEIKQHTVFGRRLLAGRLDRAVRPCGRGGVVASRVVGRLGVSERSRRRGDPAVGSDRGDRRRVRLAGDASGVQAGMDPRRGGPVRRVGLGLAVRSRTRRRVRARCSSPGIRSSTADPA